MRIHTVPTLLAAASLILISFAPAVADDSGDSIHYGEELSGAVTLRIGELLADPEPYLGEKVTVVGLVEDVCPMKGCWIDVIDQQTAQQIRFKVDDGVIEFPTEVRGQEVVAEGILEKRELTREQAVGYYEHLAEEKGEEFDPATVTGPVTLFQLQGLGAELTAKD